MVQYAIVAFGVQLTVALEYAGLESGSAHVLMFQRMSGFWSVNSCCSSQTSHCMHPLSVLADRYHCRYSAELWLGLLLYS